MHIRLRLIFFYSKSYGPQKSKKKMSFLTLFLNLFDFSRELPCEPGFSNSIETTSWLNLFCTKSYDSRKCQLFDLFPTISDIIGLVDTTDKLTFSICYAPFFEEKSYGLQTSEGFETLTVSWKFYESNFGVSEKLP